MKYIILAGGALILSCIIIYFTIGNKNKIEKVEFISKSLEGNKANEDSKRSLFIYLPKEYKESNKHYPCVYYLHGFTSSNEEFAYLNFVELMDEAISQGVIRPCIIVFPNSDNQFKGSFYTNSDVTGHWADYISKDVVHYIDAHYRTIKQSESRAICGHSMGGNGALKIAMQNPSIFGSAYALSPSALGWSNEFTIDNPSFELISRAQTKQEIFDDFYASVFMAMGRVYSANEQSKPFLADMPVQFKNGVRQIDSTVLNKWHKEFPLYMVELYKDSLKAMRGIGLEYGKQDEFAHIPATCKQFKSRLDTYSIACQLQEFDGKHYDKMGGIHGRIYEGLLPFLNKHLIF